MRSAFEISSMPVSRRHKSLSKGDNDLQYQIHPTEFFGEKIHKLVINLDLFLGVLKQAQYESGNLHTAIHYSMTSQLRILGELPGCLSQCGHLLNQKFFLVKDDYIKVLNFYGRIEAEVHRLGELVTCHNIKEFAPRLALKFEAD